MPPRKEKTARIATVTSQLRPEVAALFSVRQGLASEFVCTEFGRVNLREIDVPTAEMLAAKGYLKKLDQADPD